MSKGTWQGSGTWRSSGPDLSALIGPATFIGIIAAVAVIVMEFAALIAAASCAVLVAFAATLAWWKLRVEPKHRAAIAAAFAARRDADAAKALQRQRFALDLAAASAPQIQNVIDPAPFVAAALAALGVEPQPVRVVRGEVEQ